MNRTLVALVVAGALAGAGGAAFAQSYPAVPPPGTPAPYPDSAGSYPGNAATYPGNVAPYSGNAPSPYPGNAPLPDPNTPPPLPALSAEQEANLERELSSYRREVDDRVARGQITEQEAAKLLSWRRWQLARQIAGLAPPEPPVVVRREYVAPPPYYAYDPYYPRPYWGPGPYWVPRVSICAGGWGHHSFGSLCF